MKTETLETEVNYSLLSKFKDELTKWCKTDSLGIIFYQLFSLKTNDELQSELEYLYTLYKGTDSYFKKSSIDCWFAIWHKSIRQCDYFDNCYQNNKVELISKEERAEFKFLMSKVREKEFSKTDGKADGKLFNDAYNRYLQLREIVRREEKHDSINGKMDSILYNAICIDSKNMLYETFIKTFNQSNNEPVN